MIVWSDLLNYVQSFLLVITGSTTFVVAIRALPRSYARAHHIIIALLLISTGLQRILLAEESPAATWWGYGVLMPLLVVAAASSLLSGMFPRSAQDEVRTSPWMTQATFILLVLIIASILFLFAWSVTLLPYLANRQMPTPTPPITMNATITTTPTIFRLSPTIDTLPTVLSTPIPNRVNIQPPPISTETTTPTATARPTPTRVIKEEQESQLPPPTEKPEPIETPCFRGNSGKPCK